MSCPKKAKVEKRENIPLKWGGFLFGTTREERRAGAVKAEMIMI